MRTKLILINVLLFFILVIYFIKSGKVKEFVRQSLRNAIRDEIVNYFNEKIPPVQKLKKNMEEIRKIIR